MIITLSLTSYSYPKSNLIYTIKYKDYDQIVGHRFSEYLIQQELDIDSQDLQENNKRADIFSNEILQSKQINNVWHDFCRNVFFYDSSTN